MAQRIYIPEWRDQNQATRYPFAETATLTNAEGRIFTEGTLLDAVLYVIGAQERLYVSSVVIDHEHVTVNIGDALEAVRASGTFLLVSPPEIVELSDSHGRPAGILVSDSNRLSVLQSWGVGTHVFRQAETEFAATVCIPTPELGLRGILLPDGNLMVGDVWLVGDDGVVFRTEETTLPPGCGVAQQAVRPIRVDVVGDPLFRQRLCLPQDLFTAPRFVRRLRIISDGSDFTIVPDQFGDIKLVTHGGPDTQPAARFVPDVNGLTVQLLGTAVKDL